MVTDVNLQSLNCRPYDARVSCSRQGDRQVQHGWVRVGVVSTSSEHNFYIPCAAGANAFALDTRSKRQWESKAMSVETADSFKQACKDYGFGPEHILPHGSYLINLASAKPELLEKSYTAFVDELKRCEMLGIRFACTPSHCTYIFVCALCLSAAAVFLVFWQHVCKALQVIWYCRCKRNPTL